jgi:hypothetical protein
MPRASTQQLVRSQLDAVARHEERYLDLQIDWVREKSGTHIARFGGLWDRREKAFVGDTQRSQVIAVHGRQVEAIQLFDTWLVDHLRGPDPAVLARVREMIEQDMAFDAEAGALLGLSELFLTGGRRSGKTFIMEGILCSYAVAVPESIVWTVVPTEGFLDEPRKVIADKVMPKAWYEYNGSPQFTFYLVNGSQHVLRSGHKATSLKKGQAALVGLNKGQQIDMEGAIEFLALAPFYGCSYVESAWVTRADGRQVPAELVCVPHRRFMFDPQSRPCLTSETNPYPGDLLERRPGSSWLRAETHRWRRQVQAGILRTVTWWALFKRMSVRDWLIFAEKFGIPLIIGKPGDDDNETTRKALRAAIDALGTEGRAILGGKATIEVLNQALRSGSGAGDHLHPGIVSLANSEISKAITAGTLTSDTGAPRLVRARPGARRSRAQALARGRAPGSATCCGGA